MTTALDRLIKLATSNPFTGYTSAAPAKQRSKKEGRTKGLAVKLKDGTFVAVGPVAEDGSFKLFGKGCDAPADKVADLLSDEEPAAPKPRKPRAAKKAEEAPAAAPAEAPAAEAKPEKKGGNKPSVAKL